MTKLEIIKECPLLVQNYFLIQDDTVKPTSSTHFSKCIKKRCAAYDYMERKCKIFHNTVVFYDVKLDKKKEE